MESRKRILATVKAIEGHVLLSCIAMGIIQMVSMKFSGNKDIYNLRYLRTPSKEIVSEATVIYYFRRHIIRVMAEKPESAITRIIKKQQIKPGIDVESQAS